MKPIDLMPVTSNGIRTLILELRPGAVDLLLRSADGRRYLSVPIGALLSHAIRTGAREWQAKLDAEQSARRGDGPSVLPMGGIA
jgi:hypothetical protein